MKRTTCTKDLHDLTDPANVITKANGYRQCRPCQRMAKREARRRRREGEAALYPHLSSEQNSCSVEDCDRPRHRTASGGRARWCMAHQMRMLAYGEPYADVPLNFMPGVPLPEQRAVLRATAGRTVDT